MIRVNCNNNFGFKLACSNGHLEVLKWLKSLNRTSSEDELGREAGVRVDDEGLLWAAKRKQWNVVEWIIFECKLEETEKIQEFSKECTEVDTYLRIRQENESLKAHLKEFIKDSEKSDCSIVRSIRV